MSERLSRVGVEQTTCSMMIFCWYWNYRLTLVSTTYDDMIRIPFRHPRIYLTRPWMASMDVREYCSGLQRSESWRYVSLYILQ